MPFEVTLTNEQQVRVTATPTTTGGRPAQLDGSLRASVISGEGSVMTGANDNEVVLVSSDNPGDTSYLIEGDADLGEGVELIQDTVVMHVTGARASNLGIAVGQPELK